jgi:hypothetical protein
MRKGGGEGVYDMQMRKEEIKLSAIYRLLTEKTPRNLSIKILKPIKLVQQGYVTQDKWIKTNSVSIFQQ